jgi:hypothetical protein
LNRLIDIRKLQVGDDIDYKDTEQMRWFKGSIMDIEDSNEYKLIYVEFAREH